MTQRSNSIAMNGKSRLRSRTFRDTPSLHAKRGALTINTSLVIPRRVDFSIFSEKRKARLRVRGSLFHVPIKGIMLCASLRSSTPTIAQEGALAYVYDEQKQTCQEHRCGNCSQITIWRMKENQIHVTPERPGLGVACFEHTLRRSSSIGFSTQTQLRHLC